MDIKYYSKGNTCADCGKLITDYATWCRSCAVRHYNRADGGAKRKRTRAKTYKPATDTQRCRSCMFSCKQSSGSGVECDYITIMGRSRMCFGKECDKYRKGKLKKIYGKDLTLLRKHTKHVSTYRLISSDEDAIEVIQVGTGIIRRLER